MNTKSQRSPVRIHFAARPNNLCASARFASAAFAVARMGLVVALIAGCSALPEDAPVTPYYGEGSDFAVESSDLGCVSAYRRAGGLYLVNFLGLIEDALQVAESEGGGVYPVGTLIQAIPGEAMIKRGPGFSDATDDWEFLILQNDGRDTAITARGTTDVENAGGTCAACHGKADPQWDYVCLQDHGCDPIPASMTLFQTLRDSDARCADTANNGADDRE